MKIGIRFEVRMFFWVRGGCEGFIVDIVEFVLRFRFCFFSFFIL